MLTTVTAQIVQFARPNIQICDADELDLGQWICAQYVVGVKDVARRKPLLARVREIRPPDPVLRSDGLRVTSNTAEPAGSSKIDTMMDCDLSWRAGRYFTLSSPAILFTEYTAPCRKAFGRMLIHPVGELRCAHQAGLHRDLCEVRRGDSLLVAICG
jgi:hypothetical protein